MFDFKDRKAVIAIFLLTIFLVFLLVILYFGYKKIGQEPDEYRFDREAGSAKQDQEKLIQEQFEELERLRRDSGAKEYSNEELEEQYREIQALKARAEENKN